MFTIGAPLYCYTMDFTSFQLWYLSVIECIYYAFSLFRVFTSSYMFLSNAVIMEHFGDKDIKTRSYSQNQPESTSESKVDRQTSLVVDRQRSARAGRLFMTDLKPKFHIITRLPLADFDQIFMCLAILLGYTHFLIFIHLHKSLGFYKFEEKIQDSFRVLYETPVFLSYSIYAFQPYIFHVLCYV